MTVIITYRLSDNFRFIISNSVKSYKECTLYIASIESDFVYLFILKSDFMEGNFGSMRQHNSASEQ